MSRMGVDDQLKKGFQALLAPDLQGNRGALRLLDQELDGVEARLTARIDGVDARRTAKMDGVDSRLTTKIDALDEKIDFLKGELIAEIRRVDTRIDGLDRELRTAIDIRERLAALEARRSS